MDKCETFQVVPTDATGSHKQRGGPIISAGVKQDQRDQGDLCALNCTLAVLLSHCCSEISHRAPVKRTARTRLMKHNEPALQIRKLHHNDMALNQYFSTAEFTVFNFFFFLRCTVVS